jgi:hypothetical protein
VDADLIALGEAGEQVGVVLEGHHRGDGAFAFLPLVVDLAPGGELDERRRPRGVVLADAGAGVGEEPAGTAEFGE